jgi:hypothetical protein
VHISGPNSQDSNSNDPSDSSDDSGNVAFTTVSDVKTEVTQVPHSGPGIPNSGNNPTGGGGDDPVDGGGNGSGVGVIPSGDRGLSPGIVAAVVIGTVLSLAMLAFFLRKRVRKRRAALHTRWLSSGEKGSRPTFRSSFGDLRASTFIYHSDDSDNSHHNRYSGPFSDNMAVASLSSASAAFPAPWMMEVIHIAPPAIAVRSTGRRSSRNSEFSIGSAGSDGADSSEGQRLAIRTDMRYSNNGELSPTDQPYLPSPISVRPFSPSESWSFPKPPISRPESLASTSQSKGFPSPDPFADPVPQLPPLGFSLVETVTRTFEPEAADELVIEIGDEVSVLIVFDDGWGKVKLLRRKGNAEGVQGMEGLIPIGCLRPEWNKSPVFVDANLQYLRQVNALRW